MAARAFGARTDFGGSMAGKFSRRSRGALAVLTALLVTLFAIALTSSGTLAAEAASDPDGDATQGLAAYHKEADDSLATEEDAAGAPSPSDAAGAPNASTAANYEGNARGFFAWLGDDYANDYFTNTTTSTYDGRTFVSFTNMGASDDATSLDNMKAALAYIPKGNELRVGDDIFTGLSELKVSSGAMAVSQVHANWSRHYIQHADNAGDDAPYGENIAWSFGSDPFIQWYDNEKAIYIDTQTEDGSTGHYLNIVRSTHVGTGFAISNGGDQGYPYTYVQNFTYPWNSDRLWNYSDYLSYFNTFYNAHDISTATVTGLVDKAYTGSAQIQDLKVTIGSKTLSAGTDYTVSYSSNTNVGTATVTLTGTGNFTGRKELTFKILAQSIESATISAVPDQTWTGSEIRPALTIKLEGRTLVEGTDYTVAYSNNVNVGTASFTVSGRGGIGGELQGTFKIVPVSATPQVTLSQTSFVYNGSVQRPSVSSVKVSLGGSTVTVPSSSYSVTYASGCTNAGTYNVTVRLTGNYSGTSTTSFTITKAEQVVSAKNVSVALGKTATIQATTSGDGAITYQSANTSIATVSSSGVVTPVATGTTTVTIRAAETTNYKAGTASIQVVVGGTTPVIAVSDVSVVAGSTVDLGATTTGDGSLSYKCSNEAIAKVSASGIVTGVSAGTATITVTSAKTSQFDAVSKDVKVTVTRAKATITAADASVVVGSTVNLGATTTGNGALSYKSSNESIAKVSSTGVVTGVSYGTATVTVTSAQTGQYEAASKSVTVTVSRATPTISVSNVSVATGSTVSLGATTTSDGALSYRSSNDAVATVSSTGVVTGVSAGTATITVASAQTAKYSATSKSVTVTVTRNASELSHYGVDADRISLSDIVSPEDLDYTVSNDGTSIEVWSYNGNEPVVAIPAYIDGLPVTYIGDVFNANSTIEEVYLPDTVTVLSDSSFMDCSSLRAVNLGSITSIDDEVFFFMSGCNSIERLTMSDEATFAITALNGGPGVNIFTRDAIDSLRYIYIGSSMNDVSPLLFYGDSLEWVDVGEGNAVYSSVDGVVYSADGTELLVMGTSYSGDHTVPDTCTAITGVGFQQCSNAGRVYIPETVTSINGTQVFSDFGGTIVTPAGSYTAQFIEEKGIEVDLELIGEVDPPEAISIATATVEIEDQTYTGSALTPKPRVVLKGVTLVEGTDYELSYSNNVEVGTATVTITGKGDYTGTKRVTFEIVSQQEPTDPKWKRLAGDGRYDTMAKIVQEGWSSEEAGVVVLANGYNFKDALAAAGFAGRFGAPVVLTDGGRGDKVKNLSSQARSELLRLNPDYVIVAGGPFAVPDAVVNQVVDLLPDANVGRVSGKNACSTSAKLATELKGYWGNLAIIATDKSFKDALSAAPLSYATGWPILLASGGKSLNDDVLNALKECEIEYALIVGGTAAVTPNVENQLTRAGIRIADRLAGRNGVETSRKIAEFALEEGLSATNMAFATSQNFPDALAGAALCGKNGSVLLLCDDKAQGNLSFAEQHASEIETGYVFGGELAFSERLFSRLPE